MARKGTIIASAQIFIWLLCLAGSAYQSLAVHSLFFSGMLEAPTLFRKITLGVVAGLPIILIVFVIRAVADIPINRQKYRQATIALVSGFACSAALLFWGA